MKRSKKRELLHGAGVLAAAGIVVKVTGALYKIPLGIMLGPVGMANFSIAYNIYSLLFVLATAGVPVAVSKMVAESLARDRAGMPQKIFSVSRKAFFIFGLFGFAIMFFGAEMLSNLMGSSDSAPAIRAISPAVTFRDIRICIRQQVRKLQNRSESSLLGFVRRGFLRKEVQNRLLLRRERFLV